MQALLEKFPIVTAVALLLVVIGGVDLVIDNELSKDYEKFVETIAWVLGPVAVGRGLQARKS